MQTTDLQIIDEFVAHLSSKARASNTEKSYRSDLLHFSKVAYPVFAKQTDVLAFIEKLKAEGYSNGTILRKICSLRAFYKWLQQSGKRNTTPMTDLPRFEVERPDRVATSEDDVNAIIAATNESGVWGARDAAMIRLLFDAGLKSTEIVALRCHDIGFASATVYVHGPRPRTIPVNTVTLAAIAHYLHMLSQSQIAVEPEGLLFLNKHGQRLSDRSLRRKLQLYITRAGVKGVSPKTLRFAVAKNLIEKGEDISAVRKRLGFVSKAALRQLEREKVAV